MKKKWEEPKIQVQEFVANEYVAACYYLACERGNSPDNVPDLSNWNNIAEKEAGDGVPITHAKTGIQGTCGDASANRVLTTEGSIYPKVQEKNGVQGWISGGFDKWEDVVKDGKIGEGDIIYWHTESNNGDRRWNHWGHVGRSDANHS